ncbi:hypothetical protein [Micromonospora sp. NBRC 107095]|uniref:hypothetical protein n=1 Tax=Micromonospora sp. NBRC 107095 TaxID=3032209 RepID=UPI00249FF3C0|nr:hypothetical protein [Micromonospora sp. NBRC 107095]GLZ62877.1 hypothetical protein Misp05_64530 [Micromonospora sp. NBRC 107095]
MALMTAVRPTAAGTLTPPSAVSASDTISANDLGSRGAYLLVANGGGSPITVTVSDASRTPAGNAGTTTAQSVANATTKSFYISPAAVDFTTNVVTVTFSGTTSVTYQLLPLG